MSKKTKTAKPKICPAKIIKKVDKGQDLTQAERDYLKETAATPPITNISTAKNFVELAEILGVSRQIIYQWKKLKGAPTASSNGKHSVTAWRQFCRKHGLKHNDRRLSSDGETLEDLKVKKLIVEIAEREHRLATKRGEYVELAAVAEQWTFHINQAIALLRNMLENELPPMLAAEDDAAVIRVEMSRVIDEYIQTLHEGNGEGEV